MRSTSCLERNFHDHHLRALVKCPSGRRRARPLRSPATTLPGCIGALAKKWSRYLSLCRKYTMILQWQVRPCRTRDGAMKKRARANDASVGHPRRRMDGWVVDPHPARSTALPEPHAPCAASQAFTLHTGSKEMATPRDRTGSSVARNRRECGCGESGRVPLDAQLRVVQGTGTCKEKKKAFTAAQEK